MKLKTDGIVRSAAVILALTLLFALCFACLTVRAETTGAVAEAGENADAGRFAKSGYPKLDPNAGTGDRAVYGLKIVGIGMGVVFLVLLILMAVLYVFKLFATRKKREKSGKKEADPEIGTAAPEGQDDEALIVAVATSAIAAARGESECAFRVISIRKIS